MNYILIEICLVIIATGTLLNYIGITKSKIKNSIIKFINMFKVEVKGEKLIIKEQKREKRMNYRAKKYAKKHNLNIIDVENMLKTRVAELKRLEQLKREQKEKDSFNKKMDKIMK